MLLRIQGMKSASRKCFSRGINNHPPINQNCLPLLTQMSNCPIIVAGSCYFQFCEHFSRFTSSATVKHWRNCDAFDLVHVYSWKLWLRANFPTTAYFPGYLCGSGQSKFSTRNFISAFAMQTFHLTTCTVKNENSLMEFWINNSLGG